MRYLLFLFFLITTPLFSNDIQIVVSKNCGIKSLNSSEIKEIFLKTRTRINGVKITPLMNQKDLIQDQFIKKYLNKNIYQFRSYWARMIFTGDKTPPNSVDLDSFNQNNKCYITYLKKPVPANWSKITID